jgi:signal recognition particle subunit SRP14
MYVTAITPSHSSGKNYTYTYVNIMATATTDSCAKSVTPPTSASTTTDSLSDLHPENPLPVLIRATNGKSKQSESNKIKLSTVVAPADLDTFFTRYADVCKTGMAGLKKRDRTAAKAKAKAKKAKLRKGKEKE